VPNLVVVKVGSPRAVDVCNAFESADIIEKERRPAGGNPGHSGIWLGTYPSGIPDQPLEVMPSAPYIGDE